MLATLRSKLYYFKQNSSFKNPEFCNYPAGKNIQFNYKTVRPVQMIKPVIASAASKDVIKVFTVKINGVETV